ANPCSESRPRAPAQRRPRPAARPRAPARRRRAARPPSRDRAETPIRAFRSLQSAGGDDRQNRARRYRLQAQSSGVAAAPSSPASYFTPDKQASAGGSL